MDSESGVASKKEVLLKIKENNEASKREEARFRGRRRFINYGFLAGALSLLIAAGIVEYRSYPGEMNDGGTYSSANSGLSVYAYCFNSKGARLNGLVSIRLTSGKSLFYDEIITIVRTETGSGRKTVTYATRRNEGFYLEGTDISGRRVADSFVPLGGQIGLVLSGDQQIKVYEGKISAGDIGKYRPQTAVNVSSESCL